MGICDAPVLTLKQVCHEIVAMNSPALARWIPALTWLRGDVVADFPASIGPHLF
jgi:hypothetical protein